MEKTFLQGEIWLVRLDPTEGAEIKKTRPCLIVSRDKINEKLNPVTIVPFSSGITDKSILLINTPASKMNGLKTDSHLVLPQIRTIAKHRCMKRFGVLEKSFVPLLKRSFQLYFWS